LKIALINLTSLESLQPAMECFDTMNEEIIDLNIDIYSEENYIDELEDNKYIKENYPQFLHGLSLLDYRDKYKNLRYHAKQNKYDIAIDTECSLKSALVTYLISGRTAGFRLNTLGGKILAKLFYDECIDIQDKNEIAAKTKLLLSKPFVYEID
jgi:ADP-heptose:LPS heptosyltransferase